MCGKKQIEVKTLSAGDIGAVNKLAITKTGDTLSDPKNQVEFEKLIFPKPALSLAVLLEAVVNPEPPSNKPCI